MRLHEGACAVWNRARRSGGGGLHKRGQKGGSSGVPERAELRLAKACDTGLLCCAVLWVLVCAVGCVQC